MRQFYRVTVCDVTNASGNEKMLRKKGVKAEYPRRPYGNSLVCEISDQKPELDMEDWKGLATVHNVHLFI